MNRLIAIVCASCGAGAAVAMAFALWLVAYEGMDAIPALPMVLVMVFVVAIVHVLFLGLPIAGWLLWRDRFTPARMILAGILTGGASAAVILQRSSFAKMTTAAWIDYVASIGMGAALGMVGAFAYYAVYRATRAEPTRTAARRDGI